MRCSQTPHAPRYKETFEYYWYNFEADEWPHSFWPDYEEYAARPQDCTRAGRNHKCWTPFKGLGAWDNQAKAVSLW